MNKAPTATLKEAYEKCAAPPFQKDGVLRSEYPMKLNDTNLTLKIFKGYLKSSPNHSDAQVCFWYRSPAQKFGHAHAHQQNIHAVSRVSSRVTFCDADLK